MSPVDPWRTDFETSAYWKALLCSTFINENDFRQALADQVDRLCIGRRVLVLVPIAERCQAEETGALLQWNLHTFGGGLTGSRAQHEPSLVMQVLRSRAEWDTPEMLISPRRPDQAVRT